MKYYDYCVFASPEGLYAKATALGWGGLCILSKEAQAAASANGLDIVRGLVIETQGPQEARKLAARNRASHEVIVVKGLSEDVNREAVETPEVDILVPAPKVRMDFIMARLAQKSSVSIGFDFGQLLHSSGEERGHVFMTMKENARLAKRFRANIVLTCGALAAWDLRAPSEIEAFGRVLGFEPKSIRHAMSGALAARNRKKLGGGWVMPGVEVE